MSKKIEDYLHLYLGCSIELDNGGSKVYNRKLIAVGGVDDEPYCKLRLGNAGKDQYVHSVLLKENRIKPILRPLASMTEEEMLECGNMVYDFSNDPDLNKWQPSDFEIGLAPEQFQWLLSKHFDLFNLIEDGLAIPKQ